MKIPVSNAIKARIFAALIAAGVAAPSAYVAVDLTVPSEGFMTSLHLDPVGLQTTCIGHLVKKGEIPKQNYTEDECIAQFVIDWKTAESAVEKYTKVPFRSDWMKGALTDFTLNKGSGNYSSSTMLKDLNAGHYDLTCKRLLDWVYATQNGKKIKLKGLEIRASKQYKYCMGEEPADYKPNLEKWSGDTYVK